MNNISKLFRKTPKVSVNHVYKMATYNWVISVIESCLTLSQWESSNKLINNFDNMFNDHSLSLKLRNIHTNTVPSKNNERKENEF